jgi:hypothetical protein
MMFVGVSHPLASRWLRSTMPSLGAATTHFMLSFASVSRMGPPTGGSANFMLSIAAVSEMGTPAPGSAKDGDDSL